MDGQPCDYIWYNFHEVHVFELELSVIRSDDSALLCRHLYPNRFYHTYEPLTYDAVVYDEQPFDEDVHHVSTVDNLLYPIPSIWTIDYCYKEPAKYPLPRDEFFIQDGDYCYIHLEIGSHSIQLVVRGREPEVYVDGMFIGMARVDPYDILRHEDIYVCNYSYGTCLKCNDQVTQITYQSYGVDRGICIEKYYKGESTYSQLPLQYDVIDVDGGMVVYPIKLISITDNYLRKYVDVGPHLPMNLNAVNIYMYWEEFGERILALPTTLTEVEVRDIFFNNVFYLYHHANSVDDEIRMFYGLDITWPLVTVDDLRVTSVDRWWPWMTP